uniref:Uncharacterized protein n=1 Tax=Amphimedon queenslandica TaxID=400682 RepID=A0A1X7TV01_AMPQE
MSSASTLISYTIVFLLVSSVCSEGALKHYAAPKKEISFKNCTVELNNIPQTCNRSLFGIPTDDDFLEPSTSEELAALNAAYAQNCIPACIDPVLQYYRCYLSNPIFGSISFRNFHLYVQNGICGQDNGEYCYVKSDRLNDTLPDLEINCPEQSNNLSLVCDATTPQSCYDDLSTYSSRLGCCAAGLYPDVQNCRVTFDLPCSSTTSSTSTSTVPTTTPNSTGTGSTNPANGLYPFATLSMIAFIILGLLF